MWWRIEIDVYGKVYGMRVALQMGWEAGFLCVEPSSLLNTNSDGVSERFMVRVKGSFCSGRRYDMELKDGLVMLSVRLLIN